MSSANGNSRLLPYESRTRVRCSFCRKRNCREIHPPIYVVETPELDLITLLIVDILNWLKRR